jgi:hypothetical protein
MIGHINFDAKLTGKRSAGNPHAAFDEAGVGNGLNSTAPTPDPTCESAGVKLPCATRPLVLLR